MEANMVAAIEVNLYGLLKNSVWRLMANLCTGDV